MCELMLFRISRFVGLSPFLNARLALEAIFRKVSVCSTQSVFSGTVEKLILGVLVVIVIVKIKCHACQIKVIMCHIFHFMSVKLLSIIEELQTFSQLIFCVL